MKGKELTYIELLQLPSETKVYVEYIGKVWVNSDSSSGIETVKKVKRFNQDMIILFDKNDNEFWQHHILDYMNKGEMKVYSLEEDNEITLVEANKLVLDMLKDSKLKRKQYAQEEIGDQNEVEDQLEKLIIRYKNKIESLNKDFNVEFYNETLKDGICVGLQTAINDVRDILDGIPE